MIYIPTFGHYTPIQIAAIITCGALLTFTLLLANYITNNNNNK